jgi:hypothetical protein
VKDNKVTITADIQVEELMDQYPETVTYFIMNKVSPISCAGAYPKTLGEMLASKKVEDIDGFIKGLNDFMADKVSC